MFDVLVVGAGPAGLAAASAALDAGAKIAIIDENASPGGQIYRPSGGKWNRGITDQTASLINGGVHFMPNSTVIDAPRSGVLTVLGAKGVEDVEYRKLVLAVGARELFLPFPGWTLPNVMGVGGLQAMVKAGLDVRGKRIVVAGSGPLLIAVGAYLKQHGAKVVLIAEQAGTVSLAAFARTLARYPSKSAQGAGLILRVGHLIRPGRWVERVEEIEKKLSLKLNGSDRRIACDYVASAFGFVPNIELPMLMGCRIEGGFVTVDESQATTVANVYCAGEPTGIGGVDLSQVEGKIAGSSAAGMADKSIELGSERDRWRDFARELDRTFKLRNELMTLAEANTIVCRCEDVKLESLRGWESGRSAKLHTRCGMGPCQGRICGPAMRHLFGWEQGTVRPPIVPTPLSGLETRD